jgi:hypothetical protein
MRLRNIECSDAADGSTAPAASGHEVITWSTDHRAQARGHIDDPHVHILRIDVEGQHRRFASEDAWVACYTQSSRDFVGVRLPHTTTPE